MKQLEQKGPGSSMLPLTGPSSVGFLLTERVDDFGPLGFPKTWNYTIPSLSARWGVPIAYRYVSSASFPSIASIGDQAQVSSAARNPPRRW